MAATESAPSADATTDAIFRELPAAPPVDGRRPRAPRQAGAVGGDERGRRPTPRPCPNPSSKHQLSLAELEVVVYASQAHGQMLLGDKDRRGFFIGDGTGVGNL
jgi:hypothetical protein